MLCETRPHQAGRPQIVVAQVHTSWGVPREFLEHPRYESSEDMLAAVNGTSMISVCQEAKKEISLPSVSVFMLL